MHPWSQDPNKAAKTTQSKMPSSTNGAKTTGQPHANR